MSICFSVFSQYKDFSAYNTEPGRKTAFLLSVRELVNAAMDMFVQTSHVESTAWLKRKHSPWYAKPSLDVSGTVKVRAGQGLTSHPY